MASFNNCWKWANITNWQRFLSHTNVLKLAMVKYSLYILMMAISTCWYGGKLPFEGYIDSSLVRVILPKHR